MEEWEQEKEYEYTTITIKICGKYFPIVKLRVRVNVRLDPEVGFVMAFHSVSWRSSGSIT